MTKMLHIKTCYVLKVVHRKHIVLNANLRK